MILRGAHLALGAPLPLSFTKAMNGRPVALILQTLFTFMCGAVGLAVLRRAMRMLPPLPRDPRKVKLGRLGGPVLLVGSQVLSTHRMLTQAIERRVASISKSRFDLILIDHGFHTHIPGCLPQIRP